MAKKKQNKAKNLTIKIRPNQNLNNVESDNLDEPLEFPDSPVHAVDNNEEMGSLSEAVWPRSTDDKEDQLAYNDEEIEIDEQEVEIESNTTASAGSELTFVNVDPSAFSTSSSCKRKQAGEGLQKPSGKKQKLHDIPLDDDVDDEIDQLLLQKPKKTSAARGKKVRERSISPSNAGDGTADEDADAPRKFTVYVQVWSASTTTDKKSGKTSKGPPATITKGPFKSDTAQTFPKFKCEIAKVLPCRPTMLPVSKFEWKFENQAQNAPRKKIADEAGFEALVDAVRAKRTNDNVVVWLYTPKPLKEEEDWDTGNPDYVENPLDFDEEAGPEQGTQSKKALIEGMAAKRVTAETELQKLYPWGQCPVFPHMRVWHNKSNNTYFELTQMRISVWATAIAAGRATTLIPPTSLHFADDKKLKMPSSVTRPASDAPISAFSEFYHRRQDEQIAAALHVPQVPTSAPQPQHVPRAPPPGPPGYGFHPGHYYPPYMPQPPFTGGFGYPIPPYYPGPPMQGHAQGFGGPQLPGPPGEISSASSSPSVTMSHNVLLSEFCIKYNISASDQAKLSALEYMPGNRAVEALKEKEWRDFGQFTKLGWQAFLAAHRKFCKAIKSGTWVP
ncbi:hypothetical protein EDD22DRAFT_855664 [Suillus occidentalis]|nr:hypothetical protein EDD22DRAFT_855664 [Suillus occidentalis]